MRKQINPTPTFSGFAASQIWQHFIGDGRPIGSYLLGASGRKKKGFMGVNTILSSDHGGWKFNDIKYGTNVNLGSELSPKYIHLSEEAASQLTDSQLRIDPFFSFVSDNAPGIAPFTADTELLGTNGSDYARSNRDRILSDAIPALTLPTGANPVTLLDSRAGEKRNFDMTREFESGWPDARTHDSEANNWYHSDFDYVAYKFTHRLFDEIILLGSFNKL